MSKSQSRFRPLITSLSFNNQNEYLPLRYNYTLQQIQSIKKYIPKNLFKINGIDINDQTANLSKEQEEQLTKMKLKVKAVKGKSIENKKQINEVLKEHVKIIQWSNACIDLKIPYNNKDAEIKIEASMFQHVNYYLENFMVFKNILTEELYTNNVNPQKQIILTTEQIAVETDIVFLSCKFDPQPTDNQIKVISLYMPILLCLKQTQKYSLSTLKAIIKSDISNSLSIMLKHNFNTRVTLQGTGQKQFICLNSYCNSQNAIKQQEKLRNILHLKPVHPVPPIQTEQSKAISKKQYKFLMFILIGLIIVYVMLKIYPLNQRDQNMYVKPSTNGNFNNQQTFQSDQQVF